MLMLLCCCFSSFFPGRLILNHYQKATTTQTTMVDAVDDLVEDLFPDHSTVQTASIEDRATAVYFKKLSQYTEHRAQLTTQLGMAYQHFARANYISQGKKFDRTCWDNNVQTTRKLDWSAKKQYKLEIKEAKDEAVRAKDKANDMSGVLVKDLEGLKNRKNKVNGDDGAFQVEVPKVYNPLNMFSTFPPLPLREAQVRFENAVDAMEAAAKVMWELEIIEKGVFVDKDVESMKRIIAKDEEDAKEEERLKSLQQQEKLEKEIKDRKMEYSIRKKKGFAPK